MMLALLKVTWPGIVAASILAQQIPKGIVGWVNLAAIATIVAGIFVVARYKAALEATDKSAVAMSRERDAEHDRAERLAGEVRRLEGAVAQIQDELDRKPDLRVHQMLLEKMIEQSEFHAAAGQRRDELLIANLDAIGTMLKLVQSAVSTD